MRLLMAALWISAAFGQTAERVFHFERLTDAAGFQEVASALQTIADVKNVSLDAAQGALTVSGTDDRIAVAEWLFPRLDHTGGGPGQHYRVSQGGDADDDVVQVLYLGKTASAAEMEELVSQISVGFELAHVAPIHSAKALAMRDTGEIMVLAAWLVGQLDTRPAPEPYEFRLAANRTPAVRVFHLANTATSQALDEIAFAIQFIADSSRVFRFHEAKAITMRGAESQVALAEWLVSALDKPPAAKPAMLSQHADPYWFGDKTEARVFYLPAATTEGLQNLAGKLRGIAQPPPAVFSCSGPKAVAWRGTREQTAAAEQLVRGQQ
jgi:hypothetical protein